MSKATVIVDPNKPENRQLANLLARELFQMYGPGDTLAVLLLAVQEMFLALMHAPAGGTEQTKANIENAEQMLDGLKANVMSHAECALHHSAHADGDEQEEIVH